MSEIIKIMASRHSAFYSPLIGVLAGGFLAEEGLEAAYAVLKPGQRSRELIRDGQVDVMQSAVGSNFGPLDAGETDLPRHFAQINTRDGFFLVSRRARPGFDWHDLEGRQLLADHGGQPMLMLRYAAEEQSVDWSRIGIVDRGDPASMDAAFRAGEGDFVHLQGPAPQQLELDGVGHVVACVGEAMPEVAFSSLSASQAFLTTDRAKTFTRAYRRSREWARRAEPQEIAARLQSYFPRVAPAALSAAITGYQALGCWQGELEIPPALFAQAARVFRAGDALKGEPTYDAIVSPPHETDETNP